MKAACAEFIDKLLDQAQVVNASDIHLEPEATSFRVRLRAPEGFQNLEVRDMRLWPTLVRHIKLTARMDIANAATPQDGKFARPYQGVPVEYRVSSLPTSYGESLVLRVLDRRRIPLEISALGLPKQAESRLRAALTLPSGLIIVAGPTGSGKTTTLYACVRELSPNRTLKIVSVEDPIEYALPGVQQVAVTENLSASNSLRALLRHDPDVIFVGEVRDADTATLALRAALTGHLVLTSLHAPNVAAMIPRLIDLGLSRTLLAHGLKFALAQHLVTRAGQRRPIAEHLLSSPELTQAITEGTDLAPFVHDKLAD
jgi:type II secretory ATPase GspE/PulE/Tfp pilus assembly ATPase PilB-like protein